MLAAFRIPADAELPQLAAVVDEEAMAARFRAWVPAGWSLKRCRVHDVRYYPGATCLLLYTLKLQGPADERTTVALAARAFGAEPAPDACVSRPPLATPIGSIPAWLPDLRLALWRFPDDPLVPGLGEVWQRGGALFDAAVRLQHTPWSGARPSLELTAVSYVPAKRCILRYDRGDEEQPVPFYGKVYGADDAAQVHARNTALWDYAARAAPELGLAPPLGYDARLNAAWQAAPGGVPLLEALEEQDVPVLFRGVAAALAAVHKSALPAARTWRVADESTKLERARAALLRFHPELRDEVEATIAPLLAACPADIAQPVPVHGDFHCNQVLADGERIAILDFDLFGHGDPLHDVARFLSRFETYAQDLLAAEDVRAAQEAFLWSYSILVPWKVDRRRLGWWKAALLVNRQVLKGVKKLSDAGPDRVSVLLGTARAAAEGRDFA